MGKKMMTFEEYLHLKSSGQLSNITEGDNWLIGKANLYAAEVRRRTIEKKSWEKKETCIVCGCSKESFGDECYCPCHFTYKKGKEDARSL